MNKYKKLAFNTMIFAVGSFGSKLLVILLTRLYTANMNSAAMGVKDLLETTALFLQPIFTFALQEYLIRFGLDKNYDKRQVFTTSACITGVGLAAVVLIVPGLRFIPFLSFISGYSLMLVIYTCTSALRMLCAQFVRSRDMVKLFSVDGILATLTLFIFTLIFVAGLKMGVKGCLLAVILSDFFSAVFLFVVAGLHKFLKIKYFSTSLAKSMMIFALPLIPTIVMWTVTSLSDRIFIRYMHSSVVDLGESAVGLYSVANKVTNLISMVSTIFFQAWNMSAIMENDSADRSKFYEKIYGTYEAILFAASAGLLLLIKPVTDFFVSDKNFAEYGTVFVYSPLLIIAVLFMSLNQFMGGIYTATKHTKNSFWTSLIACGVNLAMNYFLIPCWGIQGAAVATLLSYLFCYWIRMIDARYYVPFRFSPSRNLLNMGLLLAMSGVIIWSPKLWGLWLLPLFCAVMVINFHAVEATVKKLLNR